MERVGAREKVMVLVLVLEKEWLLVWVLQKF